MFSTLKNILLVTGFLSISPISWAEFVSESVSESTIKSTTLSISLQDAIRATLNKNPSLQAYQFKHQALEGEKVTAALKPQWEISGEIENIAGTGKFSGVDASETTLSLSSVIELGNPREARSQLVTARQVALMSSEKVTTANLLTKVTQQFILVLASQEKVTLQEKFYRIAEENLQSIQRLIKAGRLADSELLRAKAALTLSAIDLQKSKTALNTEKIKLGLYWGEPVASFAQVNGDLFRFSSAKSINEWSNQLEKNPDVYLLNQDIAVKTAEIKQLRADEKTDIQWNAGVRQFQSTDDTAMVIGVSVPLGQKRRSSGALNSAIANQSLAEQDRDAALLDAAAELGSIYSEYQTALDQVELLRQDVLPQLEQAMVKTTQAFTQGRYSYLEFNLAQKQLLETQKVLIDTATEAHLLHARLERLTANSYLKED
jgi:outer membrane protein, heavy metal efflux system